jgi:hypothetical protein
MKYENKIIADFRKRFKARDVTKKENIHGLSEMEQFLKSALERVRESMLEAIKENGVEIKGHTYKLLHAQTCNK